MTLEQKLQLRACRRLCDEILAKVEEMRKELGLRDQIVARLNDLNQWFEMLEAKAHPQQPVATNSQTNSAQPESSPSKKELWLDSRQAAQILGVAIPTLQRWVRRGWIPAMKMPGGRGKLRFERGDIEQWKRKRTVG
jgi:excisionase family DNA binding protein